MEQTNNIQRSELWNKIHNVVRRIPREDVERDAADAPSVATDLEEMFLKLLPIQDINNRREELIKFANYCEREWNCTEVPLDVIDEYLEDN